MILKKKRFIITIFFAVLLILSSLFFLSHKTCIKYNDWAVLGHTFQEVEEKYGRFDVEYNRKKGYCIEEPYSNGLLPYNPDYYWMVADESGIITKVYVAGKPGG